jgi:hypothetical protein
MTVENITDAADGDALVEEDEYLFDAINVLLAVQAVSFGGAAWLE